MFDRYKRITLKQGNTSKDRISNKHILAFERTLKLSPNVYEIEVRDKKHTVLIQDRAFADNELKDKYVIAKHDADIVPGDYIYWDSAYWLINEVEDEVFKSRKACRLIKCNETLTWIDEHGDKHEYPVFVDDKTSVYSDGLERTGGKFVVGIDQIVAVVQKNELTSAIPMNKRFMFASRPAETYKTTRSMYLQHDGIIEFIMKRDLHRKDEDNVAENLPGYNKDQYDLHFEGWSLSGSRDISVWDDYADYETSTPVEWEILSGAENIEIDFIEDDKIRILPMELGVVELKIIPKDDSLSEEIIQIVIQFR